MPKPLTTLVYRIATQQVSANRWLAFAPDDETDCAHGVTEWEAMRRLISRWESESTLETRR